MLSSGFVQQANNRSESVLFDWAGDNIVVQDAQVVVVLAGQSCGEYRVSTLIPIVTDRCGGW